MTGEWRGHRREATSAAVAPGRGAWRTAFSGAVMVRDDGSGALRGAILDDFILLNEHYRARGERIVMLFDDPQRRGPGRYVVAVVGAGRGHEVLVEVVNGAVHECGREDLG
jgi:hypothetical protein